MADYEHFDEEELFRSPFVIGRNPDGQFIVDEKLFNPDEPPICYACNDYIEELYYDDFDQDGPKKVWWYQDGACFLVDGDMHQVQKNVEFNLEDHDISLMSKLDLLQSTSNTKKRKRGLLSRLFRSKARRNIVYGDEVIFVDPTRVNTIFNNRLPYCCMCGREICNAYEDTNIYPEPGEEKATEIQAYVTGECYGEGNMSPHMVQTSQDCDLEDLMQTPLRKLSLFARKKRRGGRR